MLVLLEKLNIDGITSNYTNRWRELYDQKSFKINWRTLLRISILTGPYTKVITEIYAT